MSVSEAPTYNMQLDKSLVENAPKGSVQEGKMLATTVCIQCHYNPEKGTLSGRMHGNPERLGDFYSSNITKDSISGIGSWTVDEIYILLRTGIKKDGTLAFDMPKYPLLSEADIQSLISFLRSDDPLVAPTINIIDKPNYSFLTKVLLKFVLKPEELNRNRIPEPDTTDLVSYGMYLSTAKYSCFDCHSKNSVFNDYSNPENSLGFFQGGNRHANEEREIIYSSNLTPSASGIGNYSFEEFYNCLVFGVKKDNSPVRNPMFPFSQLSKLEVKAIYAYLMQLEPYDNKY